MTRSRLTPTRRASLIAGAALALLLCPAAFAQEDASEAEAPPGAKGMATELRFTVTDLIYSSEKLAGASGDLGGKPGDLAGKPAEIGGKVENLAIQETETEVRIELSGDILFNFDKASLRPEAAPVLQRVAEVIQKYGKPMVRIEGHTDSKRADDYNLKLSQRRADSVKDWLVAKGAIGGVLFRFWISRRWFSWRWRDADFCC